MPAPRLRCARLYTWGCRCLIHDPRPHAIYICAAIRSVQAMRCIQLQKVADRAPSLPYKVAMEQAPHILFVEDDADIRTLVADFLAQNGYRMSVARDGRELDRTLEVSRIDLVILDIMLPKEDGLSLCRRIRATSDVPIIMLTARGSEIDRVVGLEMGADDYLTKPFSTHELLARIRALLRRANLARAPRERRPASSLSFSGWKLDLGARRLQSADGAAVPLTGGGFYLLAAFCEHPRRILTREQLLDLTRGRAAALFDRSIDIQVSRLRRKIEENPKEPALIQTVRAGGYIFAAEVVATCSLYCAGFVRPVGAVRSLASSCSGCFCPRRWRPCFTWCSSPIGRKCCGPSSRSPKSPWWFGCWSPCRRHSARILPGFGAIRNFASRMALPIRRRRRLGRPTRPAHPIRREPPTPRCVRNCKQPCTVQATRSR